MTSKPVCHVIHIQAISVCFAIWSAILTFKNSLQYLPDSTRTSPYRRKNLGIISCILHHVNQLPPLSPSDCFKKLQDFPTVQKNTSSRFNSSPSWARNCRFENSKQLRYQIIFKHNVSVQLWHDLEYPY